MKRPPIESRTLGIMNGIPLALVFGCELDATLPVGCLDSGDVYRVANGGLVEGAGELGLDTGPVLVIARGIGERERANGAEVLRLVREALTLTPSADRHARLRLLVDVFPFVTLRVREVHAYLDELRTNDALRITGDRKDQGPARAIAFQFSCVRTLNAYQAKYGGSIAKAAVKLQEVCRPHQDVRALQTMHSKLNPFVRVRTEGFYVPAADLAPADWAPPAADVPEP